MFFVGAKDARVSQHFFLLPVFPLSLLAEKDNANPTIFKATTAHHSYAIVPDDDGDVEDHDEEHDGGGTQTIKRDPIDSLEIFELIRHLNDPEHPLTLEQLNVASVDLIKVDDETSTVSVQFTPTIPACSMATLIGLCIRAKLLRALPSRFKVDVTITPGTHASEAAVNKQLADKERVAAALENGHLLDVVNKCLKNTDKIEEIAGRV